MLENNQYIESGLAEEIINSNLSTGGVSTLEPTTVPRTFVFSPKSGPVLTSVMLTGLNLSNATRVRFNGIDALFTTVSQHEIRATVPLDATSGSISVEILNDGFALTLTSQEPFLINPRGGDVTAPLPIITSVAPNTGGKGTLLSIRGENFTNIASVRFHEMTADSGNGRFHVVPASFEVLSPAFIKVTVPDEFGNVAIVITTEGGLSATTTDFAGTQFSSLSFPR